MFQGHASRFKCTYRKEIIITLYGKQYMPSTFKQYVTHMWNCSVAWRASLLLNYSWKNLLQMVSVSCTDLRCEHLLVGPKTIPRGSWAFSCLSGRFSWIPTPVQLDSGQDFQLGFSTMSHCSFQRHAECIWLCVWGRYLDIIGGHQGTLE